MQQDLLKRLQNAELEILEAIHDFCERNTIMYSLYCGTAIGAVRHGGFIPWDDDIDIVMTREEYNKFCECWEKNAIIGYHLQNIEDGILDISHAKVRKDNTILLLNGEDINIGHHGIWVDIFILEKVKETLWGKIYIFWNGAKKVLFSRNTNYLQSDDWAKKIIKKVIGIFPLEFREKQVKKADKSLQKYIAIAEGFSWRDLSALQYFRVKYPKYVSEQCVDISFEGKTFKIFKEYDEMLKILYGDYMQLPPEEQRICTHKPVKVEF